MYINYLKKKKKNNRKNRKTRLAHLAMVLVVLSLLELFPVLFFGIFHRGRLKLSCYELVLFYVQEVRSVLETRGVARQDGIDLPQPRPAPPRRRYFGVARS